jgi:hypothetical protein
MTPKKQVSLAIRILRGERDASARATHLEAATRKFLVTTNERKYMSTKTNFKRIALVAIAALGLGVLSSVPSQAVTSSLAIVATNGTATTAKADSTTAASFTVNANVTAVGDTIVVAVINKSAPAGAGAYVTKLYVTDTTSTSSKVARGATSDSATTSLGLTAAVQLTDSITTGTMTGFSIWGSSNSYVGAKFGLQIESTTQSAMPIAGTYVYSVVTTLYSSGSLNTVQPTTTDVSIVVPAAASASLTAAASTSTALMSEAAATTFAYQTVTVDSVIATSATASANNKAVIRVTLNNITNTVSGAARESITVSIDKGLVGLASGGAFGRSVTLAATSAFTDIGVRSDGTSGLATIKISTPSVTFPSKTVTFYGTGTAIKAGAISSVVGNGGNLGVWGTETDATGTDLGAGTDLYAYSSDTSIISNYGTACTWNSSTKYAECSLTAVKDGTATITLRDASTLAASTIASSGVSVRAAVNKVATSYKVTTDKASYSNGALGSIIVTVYDADGKVMPAGTYSNLFATGGISPSLGLTSVTGGGTLSSVSVTTVANPVASALLPVVSLDPIMQYYVNMPTVGGTLGLAHKGGSSLPTAAQVTTTTPVTITDNAAAALAAVTALATTVASLRTLITTLTNLVLKIQKKVKA